jgi:predicted nucleic acid-binding protein
MIVVVADTSPLNYLVQIGCQEVLPTLFEQVFVPAAVLEELQHAGTPAVVQSFVHAMPQWIVVRRVDLTADPTLAMLDPGEREAIQLAKDEHAELLLMDERIGVRLARQQGLKVLGTLGVLVQAAQHGLVDIETAFAALRATDFRCTPQVFEQAKQQAEKKRPRS